MPPRKVITGPDSQESQGSPVSDFDLRSLASSPPPPPVKRAPAKVYDLRTPPPPPAKTRAAFDNRPARKPDAAARNLDSPVSRVAKASRSGEPTIQTFSSLTTRPPSPASSFSPQPLPRSPNDVPSNQLGASPLPNASVSPEARVSISPSLRTLGTDHHTAGATSFGRSVPPPDSQDTQPFSEDATVAATDNDEDDLDDLIPIVNPSLSPPRSPPGSDAGGRQPEDDFEEAPSGTGVTIHKIVYLS